MAVSQHLPAVKKSSTVVEIVDTAAYDQRKRDAERARSLLLGIQLSLAGYPL
jgi:hypothetical protein